MNVNITVFRTKKAILFYRLQNFFILKSKMLPPREGERYASALTNMNLSNKVYKMFGKIHLKDYINKVIKNNLNSNKSLFTIIFFMYKTSAW